MSLGDPPGCRFPGCIVNFGVIYGYLALDGFVASDLHPEQGY